MPGTALICIVWETFAGMQAKLPEDVAVTFEEVKFLRATSLTKNRDVILSISIHKGTINHSSLSYLLTNILL